ncbi:beta-N-acetylhexosaminidase [Paenibacillus sp. GCM10023252]|uniref:beta-N-acetylhexosaminidase n=1 Tax=Paenibacillus sp. GCM10023252 TaxID=3252649 RepID=UPI00362216DB
MCTLKSLSLREKIGQLIVTGFSAPHLTEDLKRLIEEYKIGNIILFSHNVENKHQLRGLCEDLQQMITAQTGHPAFISIDQEGGRVTRLPEDATHIPGAMAIAATGKPEYAYTAGLITAEELRALGINFNLAPVLDINNNKHNPVINVRSYGDTAEAVQLYGLQMLKGLTDGGVLGCVKHFPGHGDTSVDSHLGLPVIEKTLEQLLELELKPFVAAIESGAESIMSSHILFPLIEEERVPATMSRTIMTEVLRGQLGYTGLIVSDCLEMDAIKKYYGTARGALGAIQAGVNLVFVSHTPELVAQTVELIEQAIASGELAESVLDEAVERVLSYKSKYGANGYGSLMTVGSEAHRAAAAAMSREGICLVRGELTPVLRGSGDTLFMGSYSYRADLASSQVKGSLSFPAAMADAFGAEYAIVSINPDQAEVGLKLQEAAAGYRHIIVGLYNARENEGQLALVRGLVAAGHHVTAVALGKPYDLEELDGVACGLAAFEYSSQSIQSLITILSGKAQPTGKLSLTGVAGWAGAAT